MVIGLFPVKPDKNWFCSSTAVHGSISNRVSQVSRGSLFFCQESQLREPLLAGNHCVLSSSEQSWDVSFYKFAYKMLRLSPLGHVNLSKFLSLSVLKSPKWWFEISCFRWDCWSKVSQGGFFFGVLTQSSWCPFIWEKNVHKFVFLSGLSHCCLIFLGMQNLDEICSKLRLIVGSCLMLFVEGIWKSVRGRSCTFGQKSH